MYLPVLLVRDYGFWAWVVFAVPNVVGAGLMGWTLRDAEASRVTVKNHHGACVAFSAVTIAFHVFFAVFLVHQVAGISAAWLLVPVAGHVMALQLLRRSSSADRVLAIATFAASIAAFLVAVLWSESHFVGEGAFDNLRWTQDLMWLTPICVFGFALCPYLDLTFHRARQNTTPKGGRFAFTFGFGAFFLAMIVFTLWYAGVLSRVPFMPLWNVAGVVILIHITTQMVLTVSLHTREIQKPMAFGLLGVGAVTVAPALLGLMYFTYHGLGAGEIVYRCFMGAYGLAFPAYVWLCMMPDKTLVPPARRNLIVWASSVVLACPFFWAGFIERKTIWLVPGLLVVLFARAFVRKSAPIVST